MFYMETNPNNKDNTNSNSCNTHLKEYPLYKGHLIFIPNKEFLDSILLGQLYNKVYTCITGPNVLYEREFYCM